MEQHRSIIFCAEFEDFRSNTIQRISGFPKRHDPEKNGMNWSAWPIMRLNKLQIAVLDDQLFDTGNK
ncbi:MULTISPECIES: hypothetical protein [Paenibacillus]|jgi:hypothetical protein|uniref:Uncharacterized protein n=2 Tax=Paenibacillus lactis TaxID=228574 RepID=G4HBT1_9BACL|nr:hypothetical protein [Paenibacillus lactis]EHB66612.1 hypothetical protein PaelaDRAFT_0836 [Paenibacillus lactis 154]MBP1896977.1 hypothetical protein [Paenibacillus lactis]